MNDTLKSFLLIAVMTFLLSWGCVSCINSLEDEYPDWEAIERENAAIRNYSPPPLTAEEQREKDKKDSIWKAERLRRNKQFFDMMQAFGKAEEEGYHDVMSTYDEGYENGFRDRQQGRTPNPTEYGISYDEGYRDGYGE